VQLPTGPMIGPMILQTSFYRLSSRAKIVLAMMLGWTLAANSATLHAAELNLKLTGVFMYSAEEKRIAIISKGSGQQSVFGIGDSITDNITLKEVQKDHVVLEVDGKDESMYSARTDYIGHSIQQGW